MPTFRLALAATAGALAVTGGTATAAPPVGCYGLPDYNALVCVTSFTPLSAVPGVDPSGGSVPVTVPAYCAGTCHPSSTVHVPVPGASWGDGAIATVTVNGQPYVIGLNGGIPPVEPPPVNPPPVNPPPMGECPGDRPFYSPTLGYVEPFVCARTGDDGSYPSYTAWYVGTCATPGCTVVGIPVEEAARAVAERLAEELGTCPVESLC